MCDVEAVSAEDCDASERTSMYALAFVPSNARPTKCGIGE